MAGKTVIVLGGGVGGVVAANRLRRLLGRQHRVVLIDRNVWHSFAPSFLWVMVGWRKPAAISRDLRRLERKGIEFLAAEITKIDPANKRVELGEQVVEFDYLIISLGTDYSTEGVPGLERAWTFYTLDGADALREELARFQGGCVAILVSSLPYKCPGAPCEAAFLLDCYFRKRGIRDRLEIRLLTPEPYPLPVAGRAVGEQLMELMAGREIRYSPGMQVRSVDNEGRKLIFQDGEEVPFDLFIALPVHKAPAVVREANLTGTGAWISVDRATLVTQFDGVYALGDVTAIPLANGMMLPKAGVFAHGQAEVVARNIAAEVEGRQPQWAFGGHGSCLMETGFSKAAYGVGNFYAEPDPAIKLRQPSLLWHWAKVGWEKQWLWRWF